MYICTSPGRPVFCKWHWNLSLVTGIWTCVYIYISPLQEVLTPTEVVDCPVSSRSPSLLQGLPTSVRTWGLPAWEPRPFVSVVFSKCLRKELWTKLATCMFSKDAIFCSGKEMTFPGTVAALGKQECTEKFESYLCLVQVPLRPTPAPARRRAKPGAAKPLAPGARHAHHGTFKQSQVFWQIVCYHLRSPQRHRSMEPSVGDILRGAAANQGSPPPTPYMSPPRCYMHAYFVRAPVDRKTIKPWSNDMIRRQGDGTYGVPRKLARGLMLDKAKKEFTCTKSRVSKVGKR